MKVKMDIKPGDYVLKSGWLSSKTVPVHLVHLDLQLTEQELEFVNKAGVLSGTEMPHVVHPAWKDEIVDSAATAL